MHGLCPFSIGHALESVQLCDKKSILQMPAKSGYTRGLIGSNVAVGIGCYAVQKEEILQPGRVSASDRTQWHNTPCRLLPEVWNTTMYFPQGEHVVTTPFASSAGKPVTMLPTSPPTLMAGQVNERRVLRMRLPEMSRCLAHACTMADPSALRAKVAVEKEGSQALALYTSLACVARVEAEGCRGG